MLEAAKIADKSYCSFILKHFNHAPMERLDSKHINMDPQIFLHKGALSSVPSRMLTCSLRDSLKDLLENLLLSTPKIFCHIDAINMLPL